MWNALSPDIKFAVFPISSTIYIMTVLTLHVIPQYVFFFFFFFLQICVQYCIDVAAVVEINSNSIQFKVKYPLALDPICLIDEDWDPRKRPVTIHYVEGCVADGEMVPWAISDVLYCRHKPTYLTVVGLPTALDEHVQMGVGLLKIKTVSFFFLTACLVVFFFLFYNLRNILTPF